MTDCTCETACCCEPMTQPHYIDREAVDHEVKCWPEPFAAVRSGAKPWELRLNDRDYRVGDTLRQFEWCPDKAAHTGEIEEHRIGWALYGPAFGLPEGYVIMTLDHIGEPTGMVRRPAPMEAVAWREKVARIIAPDAFLSWDEWAAKWPGINRQTFECGKAPQPYDMNRGTALAKADAILQALAVIPTHGAKP